MPRDTPDEATPLPTLDEAPPLPTLDEAPPLPTLDGDAADPLAAIRTQMDAINLQILDLLQARARLAREAGAAKRALRLPAADPGREAAMMAALLADPGDGFGADELRRIFTAIFEASRRIVAAPPDRLTADRAAPLVPVLPCTDAERT